MNIRTYNTIASDGIALLKERKWTVSSSTKNPDGILLRSTPLHELEFPPTLKAIARAGVGVNNIPLTRCTDAGIVVFNTPGANANSVKELVTAGLLLTSRRIIDGYEWVKSIPADKEDEAFHASIETEKVRFRGPEISGKVLGVIGLGAIGVIVANAAEALGMNVIGFDPFLSVESAWELSHSIQRAESLTSLMHKADYITLHIPLTEKTKDIVNTNLLKQAKRKPRILNFARGELVNTSDILKALEKEYIAQYITDFPHRELIHHPQVITIPHLGASTPEAEVNSAIMAAKQLADFLSTGNVINSVNFPNCVMTESTQYRLIIATQNIPNMVGQITTILAQTGLNIQNMLNQHKDKLAYNIIDIDGNIDNTTESVIIHKIKAIDGVIMTRILYTGGNDVKTK